MINGHGDDIHHYTHPITSNFSSNVYCGIDPQYTLELKLLVIG